MKRLFLSVILAALSLFLPYEAEAGNWRYICVCDSVAAETADTFYVETGAYSKAFMAIGIVRANMTGATDGAFSFKAIIDSDGTTDSSDLWSNDLEIIRWDATPAITLPPANNIRTFVLGAHFPTNTSEQLGSLIMGDKLACIWDPNAVTGGTVSLYIWYQVAE